MVEVQRIDVLKCLKGNLFVYGKEAKIISENDNNSDLFIILSGKVTVEKGHNEYTAVGAIESGDFFGEVSFIMGSKRMTSVFAHQETIVLQLSQEKFASLDMDIQILIKDKVIRKLILRLDEMNQKVLKLRNT